MLRRLLRNKKLVLGGALTTVAMAALACGSGDDLPTTPPQTVPSESPTSEPASTTQTPAPGTGTPIVAVPTPLATTTAEPSNELIPFAGTLSLAVESVDTPNGLPRFCTAGCSETIYMSGITDVLFNSKLNSDGIITAEPMLATKFTLDNSLEFGEFTLRKDVVFHQGFGPMTADDVAFSFNDANSLTNPESVHGQAGDFAPLIKSMEAINDTEAVNDTTVRLNYRMLDSRGMLHRFSMFGQTAGIVSTAAFAQYGAGGMQTAFVGVGPYVADEWTADKGIFLSAFPDYYARGEGTSGPFVEKVDFLEIPEAANRRAMLETHAVQIAQVSAKDIEELTQSGFMPQKDGMLSTIQNISFVGNYWEDISGLTGDVLVRNRDTSLPWVGNPFEGGEYDESSPSMQNSRLVRNAFALAIDRQGMVDNLLGSNGLISHQAYLSRENPNFRTEWAWPSPYEEAKRLLDEAGFADYQEAKRLMGEVGFSDYDEALRLIYEAGFPSEVNAKRLLDEAGFPDYEETKRLLDEAGFPDYEEELRLIYEAGSSDYVEAKRLLDEAGISDNEEVNRLMGEARFSDYVETLRLIYQAGFSDNEAKRLLGEAAFFDYEEAKRLLGEAGFPDYENALRLLDEAGFPDYLEALRLLAEAGFSDNVETLHLIYEAGFPDYVETLHLIYEAGIPNNEEAKRLMGEARFADYEETKRLLDEARLTGYEEALRLIYEAGFPDYVEAKRLMDEAGFPNGFDMDLWVGSSELSVKIGEALGAGWQQNLGVNVNLIQTDYSTYGPNLIARTSNTPGVNVCGDENKSNFPYDWAHGFVMSSLSSGGYGIGQEIPYARDTYATMAGEADKAVREQVSENFFDMNRHWANCIGIFEEPLTPMYDPNRIASWDMRPMANENLNTINNIRSIRLK